MTVYPKPDLGLAYQILRRAELSPNHTALTFEDQSWTCAEFALRVRKLAATLRAGGVCRGDRVGYIGFNHPAFLETLYATACLGAVFVPLNFRLTGPEIRFIANDAGLHTLIADGAIRSVIDSERENLSCQHYLAVEALEQDASCWQDLEALVQAQEALPISESVEPDDTAFIMYTSGTTGLPKGAMLSHGNVFWNNTNLLFGEHAMGDTTLTCAPLFHIGGLNVTTLVSMARGLHVVLIRSFDPGQVLENIQRYKVASMFGAPTMFLMMSQHPTFASSDLSSIKALVCGGAPVPVPLMETYGQRGISFSQGYGLTETAPFASILTTDLAAEKIGSAGQPPMFSEVRIVDKDNKPVPTETQGEVCIRGPNVMKGYWNRPEATCDAIDQEGWFHSGDVGYFDQDGYLFLCDRVKDMIISGGENIYPAEVESTLYGHEAITEVAVIGLPDPKWGEVVTAIVVTNEGQDLSLEDLRAYAEKSLARYKLPTQIRQIETLPRNPAGKVLKYQLKEQFSS